LEKISIPGMQFVICAYYTNSHNLNFNKSYKAMRFVDKIQSNIHQKTQGQR